MISSYFMADLSHSEMDSDRDKRGVKVPGGPRGQIINYSKRQVVLSHLRL